MIRYIDLLLEDFYNLFSVGKMIKGTIGGLKNIQRLCLKREN